MWSKDVSETDRVLFRIGLGGLGAAGLWLFLLRVIPGLQEAVSLPCVFRALTGLYCPGCGGQRALAALFRGRIGQSLYYHPFVLPALLYGLVFLGSHALNRLTGGRTKALGFRTWHLAVLLGLLVGQWILKNIIPYQL